MRKMAIFISESIKEYKFELILMMPLVYIVSLIGIRADYQVESDIDRLGIEKYIFNFALNRIPLVIITFIIFDYFYSFYEYFKMKSIGHLRIRILKKISIVVILVFISFFFVLLDHIEYISI